MKIRYGCHLWMMPKSRALGNAPLCPWKRVLG